MLAFVLIPLALLLAASTGSSGTSAVQAKGRESPSDTLRRTAEATARAARAAARRALAARKAGKPAPRLPATSAAVAAAKALFRYLSEPGANWGRPGAPSPQVAAAQAALKIAPSGWVSPPTRIAAAKCGVVLPERPAGGKDVPVIVTPPPDAKRAPIDLPAPPPTDDGLAKQVAAAKALLLFTRAIPKSKWGSKGKPAPSVLAYQRAMGFEEQDQDGIYGPQVRAAAARVGVALPVR